MADLTPRQLALCLAGAVVIVLLGLSQLRGGGGETVAASGAGAAIAVERDDGGGRLVIHVAGAASLRFATATAASLIFPFAPHTGADVYEMLTGLRVWEEPWPAADPALLERDVVEIALQINGKLRDRMAASPSADREQLETLARARPRVQAHIDGKDVVKVIVVPAKLVNFVVR